MVVVGISTYPSQVVRMVKKPHATAVDVTDWVQPLGQEDPLEKGKANPRQCSCWRIPCTEEPHEWATAHRVTKSWIQLKQLSTHTSRF